MKRFPVNEGWITAKLSIVPGTIVTESAAIRLCTMGEDPENFEVGAFKHFKTVVRIAFRRKQDDSANQKSEI
jgi:hypothetical protein